MTNPVLEAYLFGDSSDPGSAIEMIDLSVVPEEGRNDDSSSFNESKLSKKASKRKRHLAERKKMKQAKIVRMNTLFAQRDNEEMEIDFEYTIRAGPGKVVNRVLETTLPSSGLFNVLIWRQMTLVQKLFFRISSSECLRTSIFTLILFFSLFAALTRLTAPDVTRSLPSSSPINLKLVAYSTSSLIAPTLIHR